MNTRNLIKLLAVIVLLSLLIVGGCGREEDTSYQTNDAEAEVLDRPEEVEEKVKNEYLDEGDLFEAVKAGNLKEVLMLLDKGIDVDVRDKDSKTPLYWASYGGNTDVATLLLKRGADVDAVNTYEQTALHGAAAAGHTEVAFLLLENGADVDGWKRSEDGRAPLHLAAMNGHVEMTKLLLDAGAEVNPREGPNRTPLQWAIIFGHNKVAELLRQHGGVE